jgi:hypothetical protein
VVNPALPQDISESHTGDGKKRCCFPFSAHYSKPPDYSLLSYLIDDGYKGCCCNHINCLRPCVVSRIYTVLAFTALLASEQVTVLEKRSCSVTRTQLARVLDRHPRSTVEAFISFGSQDFVAVFCLRLQFSLHVLCIHICIHFMLALLYCATIVGVNKIISLLYSTVPLVSLLLRSAGVLDFVVRIVACPCHFCAVDNPSPFSY